MNRTGFSLIEIMVTLLLIGILAAAIIPTYELPTFKAKQALAKATLFELANAMEAYYAIHHSYIGFLIAPDFAMPIKKDFAFNIVKSDENNFTIAASPQQRQSGDACETFYLDQDGNKTISGKGRVEDCW